MVPAIRADVPDFDEWLEGTNYTGSRRKELEKIHNEGGVLSWELLISESFLKDEGYMSWKYPRGINSYSDLSKTIFGPVFKAIDKATFNHKWFVKGMDISERPDLMFELFGESPVVETDFTSFEVHHRGVFSDIIHYWIMHMSRGLNLPNYLKKMLAVAIKGCNVTKFSGVEIHVPQTLMSGAVWTSSSNGVLNLLIMSYLWSFDASVPPKERAHRAFSSFNGLIEGDDGICSAFECDQSLVNHLGIDLKLEIKPNFGCASFCGINCAMGRREVLYDCRKFLRNFFILPGRLINAKKSTRDSYMRAKALSYLHDFHDCPIIGPIAFSVCEMTKSLNINGVVGYMDMYKRERLTKNLQKLSKGDDWLRTKPNIVPQVREHYQRVFGVSVEKQIELETAFLTNPHVKGCDLSQWMMPEDDDHKLMHVSDFDWKGCDRWKPYHMPDIIQHLLNEGVMGTPLKKHNRKIFSEKWSI
jgi:hypothetical protein